MDEGMEGGKCRDGGRNGGIGTTGSAATHRNHHSTSTTTTSIALVACTPLVPLLLLLLLVAHLLAATAPSPLLGTSGDLKKALWRPRVHCWPGRHIRPRADEEHNGFSNTQKRDKFNSALRNIRVNRCQKVRHYNLP